MGATKMLYLQDIIDTVSLEPRSIIAAPVRSYHRVPGAACVASARFCSRDINLSELQSQQQLQLQSEQQGRPTDTDPAQNACAQVIAGILLSAHCARVQLMTKYCSRPVRWLHVIAGALFTIIALIFVRSQLRGSCWGQPVATCAARYRYAHATCAALP